MRLITALSLLLVFAACGLRSDPPADFDGTPNCGAAVLQGLLGEPESALDGIDLPASARILRPGDAIELDFSPDRLTIDIDQAGRISSITCR